MPTNSPDSAHLNDSNPVDPEIAEKGLSEFFTTKPKVQRVLHDLQPMIEPANDAALHSMPYRAPCAHILPELRSDVPSLDEGETMIINPLIARPTDEICDAIGAMNSKVRQKQVSGGFRNLESMFEEMMQLIPEFDTQFTDEQLSKLQAVDENVYQQFIYALARISNAHRIEDDLSCYNEYIDTFITEDLLKLIPQEWVRNRIREAVHTWKQMMKSPHRNASLNLPEQYDAFLSFPIGDKDTLEGNPLFLRGRKLAEYGPSHFQFDRRQLAPNHIAHWTGQSRTLTVDHDENKSGSGLRAVIVLIHELIHVCQDNDILRQGTHLWEKSMKGLQKVMANGYYPLDAEEEAMFIQHALIDACMQKWKQAIERGNDDEWGYDIEKLITSEAVMQAVLADQHDPAHAERTSPQFSEEFSTEIGNLYSHGVKGKKGKKRKLLREVEPGIFMAL